MNYYATHALIDCADGLAACATGNHVKAALMFAHSALLGRAAAAKSADDRAEALKTLVAFEDEIASIGRRSTRSQDA